MAYTEERKFLGHRLLKGGKQGIAPKSLERAKERIRQITRRNRGQNLRRTISDLNTYLTGWVTYFRHAACKTHLAALDGWIRRNLRCLRLKQCKRTTTIATFLRRPGVGEKDAWLTALSGKGWWQLSKPPATQAGMSTTWFAKLGLINLVHRYETLKA